jgi:hypothetical protein
MGFTSLDHQRKPDITERLKVSNTVRRYKDSTKSIVKTGNIILPQLTP